MPGTPYANLSVGVEAIREVIEHTLRSSSVSAECARALSLALDGLGALSSALEAQQRSWESRESDCADFFDFAPAPCVLTDVSGNVRCANPAASELFGVPAADLRHKPLVKFFTPQQALTPLYLVELMARGKEPQAMHWCALVGGPAKAVSVEVSVREVGRRQGRIAGLCWLFRPLGGSPAVTPETARCASTPRLDLPATPQTPR